MTRVPLAHRNTLFSFTSSQRRSSSAEAKCFLFVCHLITLRGVTRKGFTGDDGSGKEDGVEKQEVIGNQFVVITLEDSSFR